MPDVASLQRGEGTDAELIAFHTKLILQRQPPDDHEDPAGSAQILIARGLVTHPKALAACMASGYFLDEVALQDFRHGMLAIYASFLSAAPCCLNRATWDLLSLTEHFASGQTPSGIPISPSDSQIELVKYMTAELGRGRKTTANPIADSQLRSSMIVIAEVDCNLHPTDHDDLATFQKDRRKLDLLLEIARNRQPADASVFGDPSPCHMNYILGAAATSFAAPHKQFEVGMDFVRSFDPDFADGLFRIRNSDYWSSRDYSL